jgi:hypothetical protein
VEAQSVRDGDSIAVTIVAVPPRTAGTAWGHDAEGRCVAFTGERTALMELFRQLRDFCHGRADVVRVDPSQWDVTYIDPAECPAHESPQELRDRHGCYAPY